jgi:hypothetical protein
MRGFFILPPFCDGCAEQQRLCDGQLLSRSMLNQLLDAKFGIAVDLQTLWSTWSYPQSGVSDGKLFVFYRPCTMGGYQVTGFKPGGGSSNKKEQ